MTNPKLSFKLARILHPDLEKARAAGKSLRWVDNDGVLQGPHDCFDAIGVGAMRGRRNNSEQMMAKYLAR